METTILDTFQTEGMAYRLLKRKGRVIWQEKDLDAHKPRFKVVLSLTGDDMQAYWNFKRDIVTDSWYCHKCAVEVRQVRCKYCGKSAREKT